MFKMHFFPTHTHTPIVRIKHSRSIFLRKCKLEIELLLFATSKIDIFSEFDQS